MKKELEAELAELQHRKKLLEIYGHHINAGLIVALLFLCAFLYNHKPIFLLGVVFQWLWYRIASKVLFGTWYIPKRK